MFDALLSLDASITLWFNQMGQLWLDPIVMRLTKPLTWFPLYLLLIYIIYREFGWRRMLVILLGVGLGILIADQMASGICKPLVARPRPTHEPALEGLVRIVNDYRGGPYGFFSSHAANTFCVGTYFSLLLRKRWLICLLAAYALTNCWTRLYLGVHYMGDILVGIIWGIFCGWMIYRLAKHVLNYTKLSTKV